MATAIQLPAAARSDGAISRRLEPRFRSLVLGGADAAALLTATVLGASAWSLMKVGVVEITGAFLLPVIVTLAGYAGQGLYSPAGITAADQLRRIVSTTTLVYLALTAALFLTKEGAAQSRGAVMCSWALSVLLVPLVRAAVVATCGARSWWSVPIVIVGDGRAATRLLQLLQSRPDLGFKPVAMTDYRNLGDTQLLDHSQETQHAMVVDSGLRDQPLLDACAARFSRVLLIPDLGTATTFWVSPKDLGGTLGLELRHNLLMPFERRLKRAVDILISIVAGVIAAPFVAIWGLWIYAISGRSPFFAQRRQSCNGQSITIYKLRTMYPDAEMMLLQFLSRSDEARAEWDRFYKLKNDPRVLPGIGRFLRRTSFDELPQLWNVLKGEMSIVGPRPVTREELERYGNSFEIVGRVKPGLTGLWQVSGRSDVSYDERVRLDAHYVRNWSIWLDITILAQTLKAVICRHGAY